MSIVAMNWALSQQLGSAQQQILLYVIADSADPSGRTVHCDPDYLARHSRLSRATVFRRLSELRDLGLIVTFDKHGARGARIYEIVCDFNSRVHVPLRGEGGDDADDRSQSQAETVDPESQAETVTVSPERLSQSHSCDCISPPLSEDSPPSPPPGGVASDQDREEPKLFTLFKASYPSSQAWDWTKVLPVFLALTAAEQEHACAAALAYAPLVGKPKQPPPKRPDGWLRSRMFDNFPDAKLPEKPPEKIWIGASDILGLRVALRIADRPQPQLIDDPDHGLGLWRNGSIPPDLDALGTFAAQDPEAWQLIDRDSREFEAWRRRIRQWLGVDVEPRKRWLEPYDPNTHGVSASHPAFRMRRSAFGLPVPCRWPPKKDGTLYDDNAPPAQETDHG